MQELVKNYDKKLTMVFNFAFRLYDAFVLFNLQFGVLWWSRLSDWTWNNTAMSASSIDLHL